MAGDRHFRKPLNRRSSAMVQHIAMKFGIMTYFNPGKPTHDQNLDLKKFKMADGSCFEKSKDRHVSAKQRFDRSSRTFA